MNIESAKQMLQIGRYCLNPTKITHLYCMKYTGPKKTIL
jgi:hypothetical protein